MLWILSRAIWPYFRRWRHAFLALSKKSEERNAHGLMGTTFIWALYSLKRDEVMESIEEWLVWEDDRGCMTYRFLEVFQVFSYKESITSKCSDIVTYPAHIVLMNFSEGYWWNLVNNSSALVGFLSVTGHIYWVTDKDTLGVPNLQAAKSLIFSVGRNQTDSSNKKLMVCCREQWTSWCKLKWEQVEEASVLRGQDMVLRGVLWELLSYCSKIPHGKVIPCICSNLCGNQICIDVIVTFTYVAQLNGKQHAISYELKRLNRDEQMGLGKQRRGHPGMKDWEKTFFGERKLRIIRTAFG